MRGFLTKAVQPSLGSAGTGVQPSWSPGPWFPYRCAGVKFIFLAAPSPCQVFPVQSLQTVIFHESFVGSETWSPQSQQELRAAERHQASRWSLQLLACAPFPSSSPARHPADWFCPGHPPPRPGLPGSSTTVLAPLDPVLSPLLSLQVSGSRRLD